MSRLKIISFMMTSERGECLNLMDVKRNGNLKCTGTKRQVMAWNVK